MKRSLPVVFPTILLPNEKVDYAKWAVVAVDQFTSSNEYWSNLDEYISSSPSTLRLTIPELYLSSDNSKRINAVNASMHKYLSDDIFVAHENTAVLVVRETPFNKKRLGLVVAIDLEHYDFDPCKKAMIRATEGTILSRIPPRVEIRKNAPLELPHIIVLIDDELREVIEPLEFVESELLYSFDLNMGGGRVSGYKIHNTDSIYASLERLHERKGDFLFAVGDGNHSLATAKQCWETLKAQGVTDHPSRYALVELENIYDEGIEFHPIHRAIVSNRVEEYAKQLKEQFCGEEACGELVKGGVRERIALPSNSILAISKVQDLVNGWVSEGAEVDYIHGDDEVSRLGAMQNTLCIVLPTVEKSELFGYVDRHGSLPRKTFSMGEGVEKRYYIECRRIDR